MIKLPVLDSKKIFEISLISFVIVEAISFLLSQLGVMDFIKGGFIIFMFLGVILLVMLWQLGMNIMQIKIKEIIIMVLILAIITLLYVILPQVLPQLFSSIGMDQTSSNSLREFFRINFGSILNVGSGMT